MPSSTLLYVLSEVPQCLQKMLVLYVETLATGYFTKLSGPEALLTTD